MADSNKVKVNPNSEPHQLNWNSLFRGDITLSRYNACVGNNGNPDLYFYAEGFADSVFLLIKALINMPNEAGLDTLIYPICFNLRHSIELTIKAQIEDLFQLTKLRKKPLASEQDLGNVLNQHDINNLWVFFSKHAVEFDKRYSEKVLALDGLISCISKTDPTGQTFRYSYSSEAKKHLTDVSVINVVVLRDQFSIIRKKLSELTELSRSLAEEYRTGTFTKNLSRNDLQAIAARLPQRNTWADPSSGLTVIKDNMKSEYKIGSQELSDAFKKIQSTRDFARVIGITVNIPGLAKDDLITLNELWNIAWDKESLLIELRGGRSDANISIVNIFNELTHELQFMRDTVSSCEQFIQWATEDRMAGLQALLDAKDCCFSEDHDLYYEYYKKEMKVTFNGNEQFRMAEIERIWERTIGQRSYPLKIERALKLLGFTEESRIVNDFLFGE